MNGCYPDTRCAGGVEASEMGAAGGSPSCPQGEHLSMRAPPEALGDLFLTLKPAETLYRSSNPTTGAVEGRKIAALKGRVGALPDVGGQAATMLAVLNIAREVETISCQRQLGMAAPSICSIRPCGNGIDDLPGTGCPTDEK